MIMTAFEITIIVLLMAIMMLLLLLIYRINKANDSYTEQFRIMCVTLSGIRTDTVDIFQKLSDIDQDFEKLTDIVDKMHRNLCVDIADKMVDRVCPSTRTIKVKGQRCELTDEELMKRINEDNKED